MALLQIAEPGQSAAPHQRKLAVGIDLGTTNSLVASVRSGVAETLVNEAGQDIIPSVVHYGESDILIGVEAQAFAVKDAGNTLVSVKRLMGKSLADIQQSQLPYHFGAQDSIAILTRQGEVNPVQVSSEILKNLANVAIKTLGDELSGVVITVPAYFDDAQRQATKDAARLANLNVLRLLNEPTAAAIAYGLDSGQEGVIAVYDLGGGTFDVSILRLHKGVFEVLATGGDSALGGDDFDHQVVNWLAEQANITAPFSHSLQRELKQAACFAKQALSDVDKVAVTVASLDFSTTLTRETFEGLIAGLVKKTLMACRRALKDAGQSIEDVQKIVMVGGSTRVPCVREKVGGFFEAEPLTSIDPDKVVAIGAAIQADILVGNKPDAEMLLLDVIPLSLGIETMGGLVEKIIPRNTTIPVAKAQEFTTFKDGQTAMAVHVTQGEREMVVDCRSLARFVLTDIPPMTAGAAHIRITFQVDADGLLSVTAMEKSSGAKAHIEVKPSYGLADTEIANMLKDSMVNAKGDIRARMLVEQKVDAQRVLESLQAALGQDAQALLSDIELQDINQAIAALEAAAAGDDEKQIKSAIEQLDLATSEFAARRMDMSIRKALKGQSVDKV